MREEFPVFAFGVARQFGGQEGYSPAKRTLSWLTRGLLVCRRDPLLSYRTQKEEGQRRILTLIFISFPSYRFLAGDFPQDRSFKQSSFRDRSQKEGEARYVESASARHSIRVT